MKTGEQCVGECNGCGRLIVVEKPEKGIVACHQEPICDAFRAVMEQAVRDGAACHEGVGVYDVETGRFERIEAEGLPS